MIFNESILNKKLFNDKAMMFEVSLYALTFISLVFFIVHGNTVKAFKCLIMAGLLLSYRFVPKFLNIQANTILKFSTLIFIFMAMYLAEIMNFYKRIFFYDKILHSFSGILFFCVGQGLFRCIDKQKENKKENTLMMTLFSLFFSLSIAGCWEIFEFSMDRFFGYRLQNNSLIDTMTDIICATFTSCMTFLLTLLSVQNSKAEAGSPAPDVFPEESCKEYPLQLPVKDSL